MSCAELAAPNSNKPPHIILTPPIMSSCDLCPELRSILAMITNKKPTTISSASNNNLTTISEKPRSHRQKERSLDAPDQSSTSPSSSHNLRHCFSSPNVRADPSQIPPRSKSPQPLHRCSMFSIGTQVVRGKRPWFRRILDAGRCTRGEKFDINDFSRVQPQHGSVFVDAPIEPMREEIWREGIRQLLYGGTDSSTTIVHSAEGTR